MQEQTGEHVPAKQQVPGEVRGKFGRVRALCCVCIPLRLGVFMNSVFTIVLSLAMMFGKKKFEDETRVIGGGYSIYSRTIIFFVEITGTFWGICGAIGAWRCQWSYVRLYNIYQWTRLVAWLMMYFFDIPLLWYCELWVLDINAAHEKMGWNPIVYDIAFHGSCARERSLFIICSTAGFLLFLHLALANQRFQAELAVTPAYIVAAAKDKPRGYFYSHSYGERSFLLPDSEPV